MKKAIFIFCSVFFLSVSVNAQQITPEKPVVSKDDAKKMAQELGLSREQSKQMASINKKYEENLKAVKNDATLTDAAKKEKIKTLNTEKQAEVNKILTPEQQTKLDAMKKEKIAEQKQQKKS